MENRMQMAGTKVSFDLFQCLSLGQKDDSGVCT